MSSIVLFESVYVDIYFPELYVSPDDPAFANQVTGGARINNTSFNVSVDNDTYYTGVSFFDESTNQYYNPTTNEYYNVTDWTYDYSTRTYVLTLDDSTTTTIEYGDTSINVLQNDQSFTYYYGSAPCNHTYELTETTSPTCNANGSKKYACSACGDVYIEPIYTQGHNYSNYTVVGATCTTNGYTEYRCNICGDSYKETIFAYGHDYQLTEEIGETVIVDETALICTGCAGSNITYTLNDDGLHFDCTCSDCSTSFQIASTVVPASEVYTCSRCGDEYTVKNGEQLPSSNTGFFSWLQNWLVNFKTWLGEKLDGLGGGDEPAADDTVDLDERPDFTLPYTDENGEEQEFSLNDFIGKFAFLRDIYDIGETLFDMVAADSASAYSSRSGGAGEAPSIVVNLGAANSHYGVNYGGEVELLDLSWYAPYKETVDSLVSGFLWLLFLWGLFKRAPDIISGAGLASNRSDDISAGHKFSGKGAKK